MHFSLLDFWNGVCAKVGFEKWIYPLWWNQTQLIQNPIMATVPKP